jgi:hypothetical protein
MRSRRATHTAPRNAVLTRAGLNSLPKTNVPTGVDAELELAAVLRLRADQLARQVLSARASPATQAETAGARAEFLVGNGGGPSPAPAATRGLPLLAA